MIIIVLKIFFKKLNFYLKKINIITFYVDTNFPQITCSLL